MNTEKRLQIIHGDCREILSTLEENSVSCVITDPPYNYEFIGRKWDHDEIKRRMERIQDSYIETIQETGLGPFKAILSDGSFQSNILEGFSKGHDEKFDEHCTIKPISLIRYLIELFLPKDSNHVVLDPFAGTGTILMAALELGYQAIGIEIEERYINLMKQRLNQSLFTLGQD